MNLIEEVLGAFKEAFLSQRANSLSPITLVEEVIGSTEETSLWKEPSLQISGTLTQPRVEEDYLDLRNSPIRLSPPSLSRLSVIYADHSETNKRVSPDKVLRPSTPGEDIIFIEGKGVLGKQKDHRTRSAKGLQHKGVTYKTQELPTYPISQRQPKLPPHGPSRKQRALRVVFGRKRKRPPVPSQRWVLDLRP